MYAVKAHINHCVLTLLTVDVKDSPLLEKERPTALGINCMHIEVLSYI